ncbi:MAG: hypothetical protein KJ888_20235, partial [Gammaproteobacteria bacterium]|nr:hypothetical protein [Gammaproteobacteria bacterium]
TFSTVATQADYVLPREVSKISILRQTESPTKLYQVKDEDFFRYIPNPTDTGNPYYYRQWEIDGVATRLAAADTIDVVSDSASDAGDSTLAVSVSGYSSGLWRTETYQLNGVTVVTGSITYDARDIFVSKQKNTTGTITVTENSGGTALVTLAPTERSPRFKVVSLYPIPSSAITMYLEFHARIPLLHNDSDVPIFEETWHYIVRLGALSKVYQYLNKEQDYLTMQATYAAAVRSMVEADKVRPDLIEYLRSRETRHTIVALRRANDLS